MAAVKSSPAAKRKVAKSPAARKRPSKAITDAENNATAIAKLPRRREAGIKNLRAKSARNRKAIKKRETSLVEEPKQTLFVRVSLRPCAVATQAMHELYLLKKESSQCLKKKENNISPILFGDCTEVESLSKRTDASLMVLAGAAKKHGNFLTFARFFNNQVMDFYNLRITNFVSMNDIDTPKCGLGSRPLVVFQGSWEQGSSLQNMFLDFFVNSSLSAQPWEAEGGLKAMDLNGIQHSVVLTRTECDGKESIHLRVYTIKRKSGAASSTTSDHDVANVAAPRVEVIEMGPRIDFRVGHTKAPLAEMWHAATRTPRKNTAGKLEVGSKKLAEVSKSKLARAMTKNMSRDAFGNKIGRVHVGRQDYSKLVTRRVKALRSRKSEQKSDSKTEEA